MIKGFDVREYIRRFIGYSFGMTIAFAGAFFTQDSPFAEVFFKGMVVVLALYPLYLSYKTVLNWKKNPRKLKGLLSVLVTLPIIELIAVFTVM